MEKNPFKLLLQHIIFRSEVFILFVALLSLGVYTFLYNCKLLIPLSFDNQIILTWKYTVAKGILPYRDIYYPYGIFYYFKDSNIVFSALYITLQSLLLLSVFLAIKKIWSQKFFSYAFFFSFLLFIYALSGIENFTRYGLLVFVSVVVSFLFSGRKNLSSYLLFLHGFLTGIIFSLAQDQGVYAVLYSIFFITIDSSLKQGIGRLQRANYYINIVMHLFIYCIGVYIGIVPFFIYLSSLGISGDLIKSFFHTGDFILYAKTPFTPSSITTDNMFTFIGIFIALFYLMYKVIFSKKTTSFNFYFMASILFMLVLLEQKSFIRSIDKQLSFFAVLLYIVLLKELYSYWRYKGINIIYISLYLLLTGISVFFTLHLHTFSNNLAISPQPIKQIIDSGLLSYLSSKNTICLDSNLSSLREKESKYESIKESIREEYGYKGKIFPYLTDPIFYVLFEQQPPYFFTAFEATPGYAQEKNLQYLEKEQVQYIIYNTYAYILQDEVPDYIRQHMLFKYILNNFIPVKKVDNYLILKKSNIEDFFENTYITDNPQIRNYLLQIKLGMIPVTEGRKIAKDGKGVKSIIKSSSLINVNTYLQENNITSLNKAIVVFPHKNRLVQKDNSITLTTLDNKKTSIQFNSCPKNTTCFIHLANIPLFYRERVVKDITMSEDFDGEVALVEISHVSYLW